MRKVIQLQISVHYANTPMQYTAVFDGCKNDNFQMNFFLYFSYLCSKHVEQSSFIQIVDMNRFFTGYSVSVRLIDYRKKS